MSRLIGQPDKTTALLICQESRVGIAQLIKSTAKFLEDNKAFLHDAELIKVATKHVETLHDIAFGLAGDCTGDNQNTQPGAEDEIERARRLVGQEAPWNGPFANDTQRALNECQQKRDNLQRIIDAAGLGGCAEEMTAGPGWPAV